MRSRSRNMSSGAQPWGNHRDGGSRCFTFLPYQMPAEYWWQARRFAAFRSPAAISSPRAADACRSWGLGSSRRRVLGQALHEFRQRFGGPGGGRPWMGNCGPGPLAIFIVVGCLSFNLVGRRASPCATARSTSGRGKAGGWEREKIPDSVVPGPRKGAEQGGIHKTTPPRCIGSCKNVEHLSGCKLNTDTGG